jgi:uncharacterized pyridoxal phosphate-containing UPF0001 family protein
LPPSRDWVQSQCQLTASNVTTVRRKLRRTRRVRETIAKSCEKSRAIPPTSALSRSPSNGTEVIRQALEQGILDIGESRPQQLSQWASMIHEFIERRSVLAGKKDAAMRPLAHDRAPASATRSSSLCPGPNWCISVDGLRLAEDLHQQASKVGRVVDPLQVNTSGEKSKFGIAVGPYHNLIERLVSWPASALRADDRRR